MQAKLGGGPLTQAMWTVYAVNLPSFPRDVGLSVGGEGFYMLIK